jgi:hypothetical protein
MIFRVERTTSVYSDADSAASVRRSLGATLREMDALTHALDDALRQATERLYAVFARYPLRSYIQPCPCCHEPGDEARIHRHSLRELTTEDLRQYADDAVLVWGTVDDFRHFLPRIFELQTTGDLKNMTGPEAVFSRLHYAEWQNWPEAEQNALNAYFMALWRWTLASPPCDDEPGFWWNCDDRLCSIGQATDDLEPFLYSWHTAPSPLALVHLAEIVQENAKRLRTSRLHSAWWKDRQPQMHQAVRWLRRAETVQLLEDAYLTHPDAPYADLLAEAADTLRPLVR